MPERLSKAMGAFWHSLSTKGASEKFWFCGIRPVLGWLVCQKCAQISSQLQQAIQQKMVESHAWEVFHSNESFLLFIACKMDFRKVLVLLHQASAWLVDVPTVTQISACDLEMLKKWLKDMPERLSKAMGPFGIIIYKRCFRKVLVLWHQNSFWLVRVPELCPAVFIQKN